MKLLLTSAGIANASIRNALTELLDKPIAECNAIFIPTPLYADPGGINHFSREMRGLDAMGWKGLGVLELTAIPTLPEDIWLPAIEAADLIYICGGNGGYLSYWMHESGLADTLPQLLTSRVYLGTSAGSMILTPVFNIDRDWLDKTGIYYDDEYEEAAPRGAGCDRGLNVVDFLIRPHLNSEYFPAADMVFMEKAAAKVDHPLYAIDDQTAIKVVDGVVEIVSEGEWRLFNA